MKYIVLFLVVTVFSSCVSNNTETRAQDSSEPLWFSNPYSEYSEEDFISILGRGRTYLDAENQAKRAGSKYLDYVDMELKNELFGQDSVYYLLYVISRNDLNRELDKRWSNITDSFYSSIEIGDSESNILKKYSSYKDAVAYFSKLKGITEIRTDMKIPSELEDEYLFLQDKFKMTNSELEFKVNVIGDIDNLIKDSITEELNKLGYTTSDSGLLELNAALTLNSVDLDNNYINKFWSITLSISDYDGYTSKSLNYKGRESQLSDEALNQSIARSVVKNIKESLIEMLP